MPQRLAAACSLIAFAVCLVLGGLRADNPFASTVGRALAAMIGTYVVAWIAGQMAEGMLRENLAQEAKKKDKFAAPAPPNDR